MRRSHLRFLAIPVFAGAAVLVSAGAANAAEIPALSNASIQSNGSVGKYSEAGMQSVLSASSAQQDSIKAATAKAVQKACTGSEAVKNVKYFVDGKQVANLQGSVKQGSTVKVDFQVRDNCTDTMVGLAAYEAEGNTFDLKTIAQQKLAGHQGGTFSADGKTYSLEVKVVDCNFQVDFFTGQVLDQLTADQRYGTPVPRLIASDNGGTQSCVTPPVVTPPVVTPPVVTPPVVTPPVVTPPVVTPPVVTPPVVTPPADSCPVDANDRISNVSYTINGVPGFKDLTSVKPGDVVKVTFTIDENCADQVYSLVSYNAVDGEYTKEKAQLQTVFDSETLTLGAGTHTLEVNVPNCFFQIDFVRGTVIEKFGPVDSDNFYNDQGRLIEGEIGGAECVAPPVVPEVLDETITAPAPVLARTGADTTDLLLLGSALLLMGGALNRASARSRRRVLA